MNRNLMTAALCLSALSLSACNDAHRAQASNPKICTSFQAANANANKGGVATAPAIDDGAAPLDECVRRWAYSLAPSRDDADVGAEAGVGACNAQLTRGNRQARAAPDGEGQDASLTAGELTSPIGEHVRFANTRALLYVVQARAAACAPPPTTNGVPEGVG